MIGGWWLTWHKQQTCSHVSWSKLPMESHMSLWTPEFHKTNNFQMNKKNAGGWTNPPEKYARQTWIISPGRAKKFKFVWNHHLDLDLDKLKVLFFKTTLSTLKCRCNDSLPFYLQEGLSDDMKKFRLALCLAWHSTQEPLQMPLFCLFFFFFWGGGCPKFGTSSLALKKSWKAEDQDGGHH